MKCTYCGGTKFCEGPSGGLAMNMLCANPDCRHWFNDLGPLGFKDLERVEPTDEEKKQSQEAVRLEVDKAKLVRFAEGRACYARGGDPNELRTDPPYSSYAEPASNVDRLMGFIQAMLRRTP